MSKQNVIREAWLQRCSALLAPRFAKSGHPLETVHVSVGFPSRSATSERRRRIGECWDASTSGDRHAHVFVSPILNEPVEVVATLTHELVHAAVGLKAKHGPVFKHCATAMGLEGKMTSTHASDELAQWVKGPCLKKLGPYPHPTFDPRTAKRIKDGTRLLKVQCGECGCVVRMTRKWLNESGTPTCGCGSPMQEDV